MNDDEKRTFVEWIDTGALWDVGAAAETDFAVNATGTTYIGSVYIYRNGVYRDSGGSPQGEYILLGNGTYAYKINSTGNENYSDNSTGVTYYALVNKGTPTVSVTFTNNNTVYGTSQTARCNITKGDQTATLTLYRNGTSVSTGSGNRSISVVHGAGKWNYTCVYSTSANYSSTSNYSWLYVYKASNPVNLCLN